MNTAIFRAELGVLWKLTWFEFLPRVLAPIAYLWLFTFVPGDVLEFTKGINFFFIGIASLFSTLWLGSYDKRYLSGGFPFVLSFVRPVSTAWLVAIPLAWLVLTNAAVYLVLVFLAKSLFGVAYPGIAMLPPLLFTTAILATVSWSTNRVAERAMALVVLIVVTTIWMSNHLAYLDPLWSSDSGFDKFYSVSAIDTPVLVMGMLLALAVLVFFVERQRRGASEAVIKWRAVWALAKWIDVERIKGFRSPRHAQLWFDLRRTGIRAAAIVCVGLMAFLAAAWLSAESGGESLLALWGVAVFQLFPLGLIVATVEGMLGLKMRGQQWRLSVFEATLPATVPGSITLKLGLCIALTLLCWTVFAAGATLIACLFQSGLQDNLRDLLDFAGTTSRLELVLWAVVSIVAFAIACTIAALFLMSLGYSAAQWRAYTAFTLPAGLCFIASIGLPIVGRLTGWNVEIAGKVLLVCWGLFFAAVALLSLRVALRKGYLRGGLLVGVLLVWGGLLTMVTGLMLYAGGSLSDISPYAAVLVVGLLCLPVAAMAWAPMALAALRHQ